MLVSIYGAAAVPGGGGADWWTYLGPFIPAALLGLTVIGYLVRKLDQSQTESKALSERVISMQEVMIPLLSDANAALVQHQSVLAEATVEIRRLREERDHERRP